MNTDEHGGDGWINLSPPKVDPLSAETCQLVNLSTLVVRKL